MAAAERVITEYELRTVSEDPGLEERIEQLGMEEEPIFVLPARRPPGYPFIINWREIYKRWPQQQIALLDRQSGELLAAINSLAFAWDGDDADLPDEGWDWAMYQGRLDAMRGETPVTACALSAIVRKDARKRRLSSLLLQSLKEQAARMGCRRLIAPVRPSLLERYPLVPVETYMRWTTDEGLPFDPWLRTHVRQGARVIKICPRSSIKYGTVREWESWTGMRFPASGQYVVPTAAASLQIDLERDEGTLTEPNIWVAYSLPSYTQSRPQASPT